MSAVSSNLLLELWGVWVLLVVASVIAIAVYRKRMKKAIQSWPQTQGEILSADIRRCRNIYSSLSGPIWFEPCFIYRYAVAGRAYVGKRFDFFADTTAFRRHVAEAIIAERPVGAKVPVYYDPRDPGRSVLLRQPLPPYS